MKSKIVKKYSAKKAVNIKTKLLFSTAALVMVAFSIYGYFKIRYGVSPIAFYTVAIPTINEVHGGGDRWYEDTQIKVTKVKTVADPKKGTSLTSITYTETDPKTKISQEKIINTNAVVDLKTGDRRTATTVRDAKSDELLVDRRSTENMSVARDDKGNQAIGGIATSNTTDIRTNPDGTKDTFKTVTSYINLTDQDGKVIDTRKTEVSTKNGELYGEVVVSNGKVEKNTNPISETLVSTTREAQRDTSANQVSITPPGSYAQPDCKSTCKAGGAPVCSNSYVFTGGNSTNSEFSDGTYGCVKCGANGFEKTTYDCNKLAAEGAPVVLMPDANKTWLSSVKVDGKTGSCFMDVGGTWVQAAYGQQGEGKQSGKACQADGSWGVVAATPNNLPPKVAVATCKEGKQTINGIEMIFHCKGGELVNIETCSTGKFDSTNKCILNTLGTVGQSIANDLGSSNAYPTQNTNSYSNPLNAIAPNNPNTMAQFSFNVAGVGLGIGITDGGGPAIALSSNLHAPKLTAATGAVGGALAGATTGAVTCAAGIITVFITPICAGAGAVVGAIGGGIYGYTKQDPSNTPQNTFAGASFNVAGVGLGIGITDGGGPAIALSSDLHAPKLTAATGAVGGALAGATTGAVTCAAGIITVFITPICAGAGAVVGAIGGGIYGYTKQDNNNPTPPVVEPTLLNYDPGGSSLNTRPITPTAGQPAANVYGGQKVNSVNTQVSSGLIDPNFRVTMQTGSQVSKINLNTQGVKTKYDTSVYTSGCGPSSLANYLRVTKRVPTTISDAELMNKILYQDKIYMACTADGCSTGADAVLQKIQDVYGVSGAKDNMYDSDRMIQNTSYLNNYSGTLVFQGQVEDPTVTYEKYLDHNALIACEAGDCYAYDSYTSDDGKPKKCYLNMTSMTCGDSTYLLGKNDNGIPSALYTIPN